MANNILKLPIGFDRANGTNNQAGTFTPPGFTSGGFIGANGVNGNNFPVFLEEYDDSPSFESGDQGTITHRLKADINTAYTLFQANQRGTTSVDSSGNICRVLNINMKPITGTGAVYWDLTVISECISFDQPPDEFSVEITDLQPGLELHPRYSGMTYAQRNIIRNANISDSTGIQQGYLNQIAKFPATNDDATNQQGQSYEQYFKRLKGIDSFYFAAFKVVWSQFFWYPQLLNPGSYIEDPIQAGGLPAAFWSTTGQPSGPSIFSNVALMNKNLFPQGVTNLTWLRFADTQTFNRTWFKVTKTWVGAALNQWDVELYSANHMPLVVTGSANMFT